MVYLSFLQRFDYKQNMLQLNLYKHCNSVCTKVYIDAVELLET